MTPPSGPPRRGSMRAGMASHRLRPRARRDAITQRDPSSQPSCCWAEAARGVVRKTAPVWHMGNGVRNFHTPIISLNFGGSPERAFKAGKKAKEYSTTDVGVDGPTASRARIGGCHYPRPEPSMTQYKRIAIDTSKSVFTLHAIDEHDRPVLRLNLSRAR